MKRKQLSPGRFLVSLNLVWFAIVALLLFAVDGQQRKLTSKGETINFLAKEIRWQRYAAEKAQGQVKQLPELEFLRTVFMTKDETFCRIVLAARASGSKYQVDPFLILSVIHRESFFDPSARSYDKAGLPLAYGLTQVNYRVWRKELNLDLARMDEIEYNVDAGTRILKIYLGEYPGNIGAALFAYWGGDNGRHGMGYPERVIGSKYYQGELTYQNNSGVIQ